MEYDSKRPFYLDLSYNTLFEEEIVKKIDEHPAVRILYLTDTNIGTKTCQYLSKNESIVFLNIANTNVRDNDLFWISKMKNLQQLVCWGNQITDVGCAHIVKNKNIVSLNMCNNHLNNNACVCLASSSLASLDLHNNPNITYKGIEFLSQNSTLIELSIDFGETFYAGMALLNFAKENFMKLSYQNLCRYQKFSFLYYSLHDRIVQRVLRFKSLFVCTSLKESNLFPVLKRYI